MSIADLYNVDCIEGLRALDDELIDLVFADPPFNIGYEYDVYDDSRRAEDYVHWCDLWMSEVHRVLTPTGTFWLAMGDDFVAELKMLARECGFIPRSWVVWYYTFGVNCTNKFTRSHTHLLHFVKTRDEFTFNASDPENRVPSARQLVYGDKRANKDGRLPDDTWILRPQESPDGFSETDSVWHFPRVAGTFKERAGFHGCQMPEQLMGRIIRTCSNPGELILDPFVGSGTTAVVAKKLGRQYLGFDISKSYIDQGQARLARVSVGDPLDGGPERTMKAPSK